jgi:hypothetical protein
MISLCILASISIGLQEIEQETERAWRTPEEIRAHLTNQAETVDEITISTIGHTQLGQPIQCIEIAREGAVAIEDRSAILVVAGIDGNHLLGSEVAIDLIAHVLVMDPEETRNLLETHKLFVIPQVNADVAQYYFTPASPEMIKNNRPVDDDNDGYTDEDSPEDINGDGFVTMMRVPDLEKATHIVDPETPRLNASPDALQGTSAEFVLYSEGLDNDNDGKFNEDAIGGVDINKNFMHGYQYHGDGAGVWQLSEAESKALADFVFAHQEIAFILVYGRHDTLSKPFKETGKDQAGAPKTLHTGDVELYEKISESFTEFTDLKNINQPNWNGSFVAWAYAQFGVPAFSTPLWGLPEGDDNSENSDNEETESSELTPSGVGDIAQETIDELTEAAIAKGYIQEDEMEAEITAEEIEMYCKMMGIEVKRINTSSGNKEKSTGDGAWLEYSDNSRNGEGFVEWAPFDHPQLGKVEIGGWVPYFKTVPPTNVIATRAEEQAKFLVDIANKLPSVRLGTPNVTQLGKTTWEIKIAVINDGWFPTGTAMAESNRRARPFVVRLDTENSKIITGQKVQRIWALSGGGTHKWFTWTVQARSNSDLSVQLYSEKFGSESIKIKMKQTNGGEQ